MCDYFIKINLKALSVFKPLDLFSATYVCICVNSGMLRSLK